MTAAARPSRDLCIMACTFCRDPQFRRWLAALAPGHGEFTEDMAKEFILGACGIGSRGELDTDPAAAERFHTIVRAPFVAWRDQQTADGAPSWVGSAQ
jgi:hypothetical protein